MGSTFKAEGTARSKAGGSQAEQRDPARPQGKLVGNEAMPEGSSFALHSRDQGELGEDLKPGSVPGKAPGLQ